MKWKSCCCVCCVCSSITLIMSVCWWCERILLKKLNICNCLSLLPNATANLSALVLRRYQTMHRWTFLCCVMDTALVLKLAFECHLDQVSSIGLGYSGDDLVLMCVLSALTEDIVLHLVCEMDTSTFRRGACWSDRKWEKEIVRYRLLRCDSEWERKRDPVWVSDRERKQSRNRAEVHVRKKWKEKNEIHVIKGRKNTGL